MLTKIQYNRLKKLAKALRSGDYVQESFALRHDTGYCCLGVACDISKVGKWLNELAENGKYVYHISTIAPKRIEQQTSVLPASVVEYYGFNITVGFDIKFDPKNKFHKQIIKENKWIAIRIRNKESIDLAQLNDHGVSFDVISFLIDDYAEDNYKEIK